jgi:hypothetical protein
VGIPNRPPPIGLGSLSGFTGGLPDSQDLADPATLTLAHAAILKKSRSLASQKIDCLRSPGWALFVNLTPNCLKFRIVHHPDEIAKRDATDVVLSQKLRVRLLAITAHFKSTNRARRLSRGLESY